MKSISKRLLSLLLCVLLVSTFILLPGLKRPGQLGLAAKAASGNYYMINGKAVSYDKVEDPGQGGNSEYVKALYEYVWGVNYTDDFSSTDNILKNLAPEERKLTPDNLKIFVQRCNSYPGAVLKLETEGIDNTNGHSVFIVAFDNNGFNVFERTNECKETYYTWEHFCELYAYSTTRYGEEYTYTLIRYIKWPESYFASMAAWSETDYSKPNRTLYYDSADPLSGDDVKWVQQRLVDLGFSLTVDGFYGEKTEERIKEFQKEFQLKDTGVVDALTGEMLLKPIKVPEKVELVLKNKEDAHISRGDILTVTWNKVEYADSYCIKLYNNRGKLIDELERITGNEASFVIDEAGTYIVKAIAQNERYSSDVSTMEQKVKVHNTFTVKFIDDDGTLLNQQSVAYGMDAATPASPKKTGYSFVGWDAEYTNVTSSIVAKAKYLKKTYTVTFYDGDGNVIGQPQRIKHGEAAIEPETNSIQGFVGWNKDFSYINESKSIKAVVINDEESLPASITNASAERAEESSGYRVRFTVVNNTSNRTVGRAVVALKTTAGKFLTLTESSAFVLKATVGSKKNMTVFVPYSSAATIAEVYIVENYNDLVPISAVAVIDSISTENNYTDWLADEEAPSTYYSVTDYRTEYKSQKKSPLKASSLSSMPNWIKDETKTTVEWKYEGDYSNWTTSPIPAADHRRIENKSVPYTTGYNIREWNTQQNGKPYYRHYWSYNHGAERPSYGQFERYDTVSVSTWNSYPTVLPGGSSSGTYWGYNKGNETGRYDWEGKIWYAYGTTTGTTWYYRYQDATPYYTYYYYQWGPWSDWSPTPIASSSDVNVKTRKTRRYEVNDPTEVNTGKTRTITGAVDNSLVGKQATLFIYKIGEASDYTNEYVGQTVIGENGLYRFSFKMREEPNVDTGDFFVTLGIEGTNTVFELEPIKAPLKEYTVNICDEDGTVLDTQIVNRGESAVLPTENPSKPGYTFAGWNYSNASIYEDTNITALYVPNEYTVVFIDWTNEKFEMFSDLKYGDILPIPDLNKEEAYADIDGSTAISRGCWQGITDGMTVTQNMVITAEYREKVFEVKFYDYEKNIISSQEVKYGESVKAPELDSEDDYMFISWDNYDYNCVTKDTVVEPIYCYSRSVEKPTANLVSGVYSVGQTLALNCVTENAVIYYSLNGSEERVYTSPLRIDESTEITYYASALGYNDSEKVKNYYAINKTGDQAGWKYPVTICKDEKVVDTYLVQAGATIDGIVPDYEMSGYNFAGYYTDIALTNRWNKTSSVVNGPTTLYVKIMPKTYKVSFRYEDGTMIEQKNVAYLEGTEPPENIGVSGNDVFVGWNTDAYQCVTDDLDVYAIIMDKDVAPSIVLNKTDITMISGVSYNLVATVLPEAYANYAIVWTSSDTNVVKVDDTGRVYAVSAGNAIITATLSGELPVSSSCEVTVYPNKSVSIQPIKDATIKVVNGKLVGVLPDANSVEEVFAQIDSTELKAYSVEGKQLQNSDLLETGATICLVDRTDKIFDAVIVVITGDINADGHVNNKDASKLMRYQANKEQLNEVALLAADTNADGHVSLKDVAVLQQYLIGMQNVMTK